MKCGIALQAGIGDENVDCSETPDNVVKHRDHFVFLAHIACKGDGVPPMPLILATTSSAGAGTWG